MPIHVEMWLKGNFLISTLSALSSPSSLFWLTCRDFARGQSYLLSCSTFCLLGYIDTNSLLGEKMEIFFLQKMVYFALSVQINEVPNSVPQSRHRLAVADPSPQSPFIVICNSQVVLNYMSWSRKWNLEHCTCTVYSSLVEARTMMANIFLSHSYILVFLPKYLLSITLILICITRLSFHHIVRKSFLFPLHCIALQEKCHVRSTDNNNNFICTFGEEWIQI